MTLPFTVWFVAYLIQKKWIQGSVSSYYHTDARNVFVGTLWAIGVFLMFYEGYDGIDDIVSNLGGLFAIGVSLFPTTPGDASINDIRVGTMHFTCAAFFLVTLSFMSLFLFTRTNPKRPKITKKDYARLFLEGREAADPDRGLTYKKLVRNVVYIVCGSMMLICLILIAVYFLFFDRPGSLFYGSTLVFWLETIAIVAFGVSWLTKGGGLGLGDEGELG